MKLSEAVNIVLSYESQLAELEERVNIAKGYAEVNRLVVRAGKRKGATVRQLKRDSRLLQKIDQRAIDQIVADLIDEGLIKQVTMESQSGRGRKRIALVPVEGEQ